MSEKRITKRDLFNRLFEVVVESDAPDKEMLCDFISHELVLLDRKHSKGVPTKTQIQNQFVKTQILDAIAGGFTRAGDIAKREGLSTQKVSALLRQLVIEGEVVRVTEGKVTHFMLKD